MRDYLGKLIGKYPNEFVDVMLCSASLIVGLGIAGLAAYFSSDRPQQLPEQVRMYDEDTNGRLESKELSNLLRDYELKKR